MKFRHGLFLLPAVLLFAGIRGSAEPDRVTKPTVAPAVRKESVRPKPIAVDADHVPVIARIMGVRVGFDTVERLQKLYGKGFAYDGGHPQGAREWKCRKTGWYVNTDGFDYRSGKYKGRVIDYITITPWGITLPKTPTHISVPTRQMRFMGTVALGMSHAEVRRLLRYRLPPPDVDKEGDLFSWSAQSHVRLNSNRMDDRDEWLDVSLEFERDRLVCIAIGTS